MSNPDGESASPADRGQQEERKDLLTVIEVGSTFHLRTWTIYSETSTEIRAWCGEEFNAEENPTWTFPMGLLRNESLCLECYYERKKASRERFSDLGGNDE